MSGGLVHIHFKLSVNVIRGEVWQFVYDTYRSAIIKGELLMGLCVNGNW